jgi:hypothetical protein
LEFRRKEIKMAAEREAEERAKGEANGKLYGLKLISVAGRVCERRGKLR